MHLTRQCPSKFYYYKVSIECLKLKYTLFETLLSTTKSDRNTMCVMCSIPKTSLSRYMSKMSTFCHTTLTTITSNRATYRLDCYQWNFSFFLNDLSTHLAPYRQLQPCLGFLLLLPLLVVYQIQQHSTLSNNTSATTYVHRMIISPPCLFKHTKKD